MLVTHLSTSLALLFEVFLEPLCVSVKYLQNRHLICSLEMHGFSFSPIIAEICSWLVCEVGGGMHLAFRLVQ